MEPLADALRAIPAWLEVLTDPESVVAALALALPGLLGRRARVVGCEVDRVRLKGRWTGRYDVDVDDGRRVARVRVRGELARPGDVAFRVDDEATQELANLA
jgi:hypothetical protein